MVTVGFPRPGPVSMAPGLTPPRTFAESLWLFLGNNTGQEEEERKGTEWPEATDPAWVGGGMGRVCPRTLVHGQPTQTRVSRRRLRKLRSDQE